MSDGSLRMFGFAWLPYGAVWLPAGTMKPRWPVTHCAPASSKKQEISPLVFNFFLSYYPPCHQLHIAYKDDMTGTESSVDTHPVADALTTQTEAIGDVAHVTLFYIPYASQIHPKQYPLPLEHNLELRRMTVKLYLTFTQHIQISCKQLIQRFKNLNALAGTSGRQLKETQILSHKSLVWSRNLYAAPVWLPIISKEF